MKACLDFILSDWQSVLWGGAVIVGVVFFLMECFKFSIGNRIKNKHIRKTVLSLLSVALVFPATAAYSLYNGWGWEYYWWLCGLFAAATILVYWSCEWTHLREGLYWIGKNTVGKWIGMLKSNSKNVDAVLASVFQELNLDTRKEPSKIHYKEDDLDKL